MEEVGLRVEFDGEIHVGCLRVGCVYFNLWCRHVLIFNFGRNEFMHGRCSIKCAWEYFGLGSDACALESIDS